MISIGEIRAVNAFTTPAMPEANAAAEVHPEQGAPIEQNSTLPAASSETAIQRTWWQRIRGIDPRPIAERAPGNINIICYYYQSAELRLELRANHEVFPTWQHLLYPLTRPTGVEELFRMILDDRSLTPRNRATRKNLESVRQNRTSWIETIRASHNNGALFPSAQYTTSDGTHSSIVSAREERGGIHLIPEAIDTQDSERIFIRQPPPASYDFSLVNLEQGLHEHLTPVIDYEIAEIQINQRDTIEVSMAEPATTDTARVHEERLFFEIPQQGTRDAPLYTTPIPRLSSSGDPYNGRPAGNSHPLSGRVGNGSGETSGGMQFAPEPLFRSRSRSFPKISEILWGTALYRAHEAYQLLNTPEARFTMRQWGSGFASNIGIMLAGRASEYEYEQFMHRVFHRNEITGFERFSAGMAPIAATVGYQLICGAPRLHTFAHVPIGMLSIAPIDMALSSSETMLGVDQNSIWTQGANLLITSALAAAAPLATVNGISSATLASTRFWVSSGMSIGTGVAVAASLYAAAFIGHNIIDPLLARPAEFIASIFMSRSSMAYICNNDGTLSDVLAAIAHQIIV